jgi:hypothetical protein
MSRHVIEVLYGERCQLVPLTIARVRAALAAVPASEDVEIRLLRVETMDDAVRLRCHGSPTVRIDGIDVDPRASARPIGTHSRGFYADGAIDRVPPAEWIRETLESVVTAGRARPHNDA